MKILVLGAGTVGTSIAELLCNNNHDVTVVDRNHDRTQSVNDELDVGVVTGSAIESSVLFQAGVLGADLCLAVTESDETNLIAASTAKAMGCRRTIARVFSPVLVDSSTFDYADHFQIDRLLSLEKLTALEFARSIRNPGSLAVERLVRGGIQMDEWGVTKSAKVIGVPLKSLTLPVGVRIGSILRDGRTWIAGADDELMVGDRVTVVGSREDLDGVRGLFEKQRGAKRRVIIAGGGETGYHLARTFECDRLSITLLEHDPERCRFLASNLKTATVANVDATRKMVLEEERVAAADFFVACMGSDEENIMACVEAREIGAGSVMSVVGRPDYGTVVGKLGVDLAVSPRGVMARQVLSFLTDGPVVSRISLPGSDIEVLELEVAANTPITQGSLGQIEWPGQCMIAAMARESFVKVPSPDETLVEGDTVVALSATESVQSLLRLFRSAGK